MLDGTPVSYHIRSSTRAKRVGATMYPDGRLVVSLPKHLSEDHAESFLQHAKRWVLKRVKEHEQSDAILIPSQTKQQQELYVQYAKLYIEKKVTLLNETYNFPINTVRVKNLMSQWGSASPKRNLNYNYKLIFLPEHLALYVIAHELCHLGEMNHSKAFWQLLEKTIPNPKKRDKELGLYHLI